MKLTEPCALVTSLLLFITSFILFSFSFQMNDNKIFEFINSVQPHKDEQWNLDNFEFSLDNFAEDNEEDYDEEGSILSKAPIQQNASDFSSFVSLAPLDFGKSFFTDELHRHGRLQINNITATFEIKTSGQKVRRQYLLNLRDLASRMSNIRYNPKVFSAAIAQQREPASTFLIFASGKCVVTGTKTREASIAAAQKMTQKISRVVGKSYYQNCRRMGKLPDLFQMPRIKIVKDSFKIQNIASSFTMKLVLRLNMIEFRLVGLGWKVTYEPELYPAAIIRFDEYSRHMNQRANELNSQQFDVLKRATFLAYNSGKVVLTGCKHEDDISLVFGLIYPELSKLVVDDPIALEKRNFDDYNRYCERLRKYQMMRYIKYNDPVPEPKFGFKIKCKKSQKCLTETIESSKASKRLRVA